MRRPQGRGEGQYTTRSPSLPAAVTPKFQHVPLFSQRAPPSQRGRPARLPETRQPAESPVPSLRVYIHCQVWAAPGLTLGSREVQPVSRQTGAGDKGDDGTERSTPGLGAKGMRGQRGALQLGAQGSEPQPARVVATNNTKTGS